MPNAGKGTGFDHRHFQSFHAAALSRPYCQAHPDHVAVTAFPQLDTLVDIDARLRLVENFDGLRQVLSLANPPLEAIGPPAVAAELARIANDCLAEICRKYPQAFPTFIAALPLNDVDASVKEMDRAIGSLGARGVQLFTNVAGKPLSAPEFRPIFRRMAEHDLLVWVHPMRGSNFPDYASEKVSEDEIWFSFGWPYETTACMARVIYSRLFDELPELKIISHHMGGMIPYFPAKIKLGFRQIFHGTVERNPAAEARGLKKPPLDYFKMLYADTALGGEVAPTRCGHAFFGTRHCLFATDAPFDPERGRALIAETLAGVAALGLAEDDMKLIFAGNAQALLKL
jgi:uncharacterized protein